MNLRSWVGMVLGGVACFACGFWVRSWGQSEPVPVETERVVAAKPVREVVTQKDPRDEAEIARLRAKISELTGAMKKQAQEKTLVEAKPAQGQDRRRLSFQERMEKMKKENPKQYEEMQKRHEEFRQRMAQREMERVDFLTSLDLTLFTPEQKENHEKLLDTLATLEEIRAKEKDMGALSEEERRALFSTYHTLHSLYETERDALLSITARSIGFTSDESSAFVDQIKEIYEETSMGFGRRGGRRNPPPPPPPSSDR